MIAIWHSTKIPNHFISDKVFKNGPSEICGRQINFIWSILEYFVPYIRNSNPNIIPNNKYVTNLYRSEAKSKNSVIITFTYTSLKNYESYSRVPNNRPLPPIVNFCIFSTQGIFIPIPSPSSRPYY